MTLKTWLKGGDLAEDPDVICANLLAEIHDSDLNDNKRSNGYWHCDVLDDGIAVLWCFDA